MNRFSSVSRPFAVGVALLVGLASCAPKFFPYEARHAADVARDSVPWRVGTKCGTPIGGTGTAAPPGFRLAYQASADSTGTFLEAALIVRAPEEWFARPRGVRRPPSPQDVSAKCFGSAGAAIGPVQFNHLQGSDTAWVSTTAVDMGFDNVLLMDLDDEGRLRIIGRAHVNPRLTPPQSRFAERQGMLQAADDSVWAKLMTSKTVRRFVAWKRE